MIIDHEAILASMLRPEGNGKVTSKADGTTTFDIRPDQLSNVPSYITDVLPAASGPKPAPVASIGIGGAGGAGAFQAMIDAALNAGGAYNQNSALRGQYSPGFTASAATSGLTKPPPVVQKTPQQHADEYLKMLDELGSDEARVQFGLNPMGDGSVPGFLGDDAADLLRAEGMGGLGKSAAESKYEWVNGILRVKGDGDDTGVTQCGPNEHLENGVCVPDAVGAQVEECGVGQMRNAAGVCVPIADASPADACPAGQVRDANGNCVSVFTPPGDPAGTIESLSENARDIAQTKLDETKTAITNMLDSGLLDITTAQDLYETETERVWKDFLSTQNAVTSDVRNVGDAQRAQRYDDRAALEEQLRAAGVNPALVGDRLDMTDAVATAGAEERGAYLDDLGLVSQMANADRKFMGEGIFGGYKQDLRSRTNELGFGAETDRIGADYDARSQALQAADLAPFLGLDPRAVAAGLASGVDIPGLSTGINEAALDRALTVSEGGLNRGVDEDRLDEQIRQFDVGIDPATGLPYGFNTATGLDAGQTATLAAQGIDPATGLPYGFNTSTGLTAGQQVSAQQFADQIASTEGMAADKLDLAQDTLDLNWWNARGDQAAGVLDRVLEKKQFKLLEDKFDLADDQFAWNQAMDIAELGDQDFNLGTQLSLLAGSMEGGAAVMKEVADYMYLNNIAADNTGYAHALAALDYGTVLTFLYTQQFMEDGTPQEVAEPLADAAVEAMDAAGFDSGATNLSESESMEAGSDFSIKNEQMRVLRETQPTNNFEWDTGATGAIGRFFANGDSFTVPEGTMGAGTKYSSSVLEMMMDTLPPNYNIEEYILFQHGRGNTFGPAKVNGKPGWGK